MLSKSVRLAAGQREHCRMKKERLEMTHCLLTTVRESDYREEQQHLSAPTVLVTCHCHSPKAIRSHENPSTTALSRLDQLRNTPGAGEDLEVLSGTGNQARPGG